MRLPFALLIAILPMSAIAADLSFSGTMERVGEETITIRLSDGRAIYAKLPSLGSLSAGKINAQYHVGDHVEISCKAIQPVIDEDNAMRQFLELTRLRFTHQASKEELFAAAQRPAWRDPKNLLPRPEISLHLPAPRRIPSGTPTPDELEVQGKLERAREINMEYSAHMPNFVADETAKRYTGDARSDKWRYLDQIETEITIKGNRSDRQRIRRDGKPWTQPYQALPGFKWSGGFGTEIRPVFDLTCPTTIEYAGRAVVREKAAFEYHFSSPADGCFVPFTVEYRRYNPARKGRIFIEDLAGDQDPDRNGRVLQLEEEAFDFPSAFEFAHRIEEVAWDYVKIGDAVHLLPVAATFVGQYSKGDRVRVEVTYSDHRHFESSTNITFH